MGIVSLFFATHGKSLKIGAVILLIVGILSAAVIFMVQKEDLSTTTKVLTSTRDTLRAERDTTRRLRVDNAQMLNSYLVAEKGRLQGLLDIEEAKSVADNYQLGLEQANKMVIQTVDAMSALNKKHAADVAVLASKVGTKLPTTVADTAVNSIVGKMGGIIKVYEDSIPKLIKANATLKVENKNLKEEVSSLENNLNKIYVEAESDWVNESNRKAFGDLRAGERRRLAGKQAEKYRNKRESLEAKRRLRSL